TAHAHLALGRVHLAEGRNDAALPYLAAAAAHEELEPALIAEANLLAGHAHEALGQTDAAMIRYEQASAALPYDPRPLDALAALGEARGDHDLLAELIGRRILLCRSAQERARPWLKRARLYHDILNREPETYRCLKEAYANDPDDLEATQMLRGAAGARGDWALVAELLYREIEAAATAAEKARLHEELASVYEDRLLDIDGAIRNFESALELQPGAPVPPGALARLYALLCRPADAARAEERAAALEPDGAPRAERLLRAGDHHEQAHRLAQAGRPSQTAAARPHAGDAAAPARPPPRKGRPPRREGARSAAAPRRAHRAGAQGRRRRATPRAPAPAAPARRRPRRRPRDRRAQPRGPGPRPERHDRLRRAPRPP